MADEESHDRIDNDCILSMARFTRNLVANVESNQLEALYIYLSIYWFNIDD